MSTLQELFDKYECDKGSLKHRYDRIYAPLLDSYNNQPIHMLEIGIFKGNSTHAWLEYCPNITITAIDIFKRVEMEKIPVLKDKRVIGYKWDSTQQPRKDFEKLIGDGFDIIIDDGLHTHKAQYQTFNNFIPYLKRHGTYIIEDVWAFNKMTDAEKQHEWIIQHTPDFSEEEYQTLLDSINQYSVVYHDLRKGYDPDTFILEIKNE